MASIKRVPVPAKPVGWRGWSGDGDPHDRFRVAVEGLAMAWGGGDQLRGLAVVATFLDDLTRQAVREQRAEGAPWSGIAESLGCSRQAAQQRFGKES